MDSHLFLIAGIRVSIHSGLQRKLFNISATCKCCDTISQSLLLYPLRHLIGHLGREGVMRLNAKLKKSKPDDGLR